MSGKESLKNREEHTILIKPSKGFQVLGLTEIWEYRDLLWYNILKNVKGKYRQMALGPLWIILQPIVNMLLFTFIFGGMAKLDSGGVPYPLLTLSALIPWTLFQNSTTFASNSLVSQMHIISKVYFPRMIIPISDMLAWLVDFAVTFILLLLLMAYYEIYPSIRILTIPFYVVFVLMTTLAIGLWTASLTVKYRDIKLIVDYGLRIFMFITPVAYSASHLEAAIPDNWEWLLKMNPLYWIIEGFRWALLGTSTGPSWFMVYPLVMVVVLLISGAFVFRRSERSIVDLQ